MSSVVLDLMIHDLDLVHSLVPGALPIVRAEGRSYTESWPTKCRPISSSTTGPRSSWSPAASPTRARRSMRVVYADGVIEIDFLARTVHNTTGRARCVAGAARSAGRIGGGLRYRGAQAGGDTLVRPEEARQALETALLIEEALVPVGRMPRRPGRVAARRR